MVVSAKEKNQGRQGDRKKVRQEAAVCLSRHAEKTLWMPAMQKSAGRTFQAAGRPDPARRTVMGLKCVRGSSEGVS